MTRLISFAVLLTIIVIIGLLFYKVLIGFFIPVFLASVLVVVFRPLHRWVLDRSGQREQVAAAVTTLLIMLTLLLPIGLLATASALQGLRLIEQIDARSVALRINQARSSLGLQMPSYQDELRMVDDEIEKIMEYASDFATAQQGEKMSRIVARTLGTLSELRREVQEQAGEVYDKRFEELLTLTEQIGQPVEDELGMSRLALELRAKFRDLRTQLLGGSVMALARETANPTKEQIDGWVENSLAYIRPRLLSLTGATGTVIAKLLFGGGIMVVCIFFFLYDGPAMIKSIMHLSPLDDAYEQELLLEFDRISRAVVLATVLSAVAQGLTAGIGFYFAGMEYLTLLIMLSTAFSMVPFVGPAVIWVPVCLYLAMNDQILAASLLAAWGILVVGTVDNVVKAFVLHGQSQLHPLLALLSVLGGVQALGPIGIVVGPMIVAILQTLLGILQRELMHFEDQKFGLSSLGASAMNWPPPRSSVPRTQEPTATTAGSTTATTGSVEEREGDAASRSDVQSSASSSASSEPSATNTENA